MVKTSVISIIPKERDFDFNSHVGNAAITRYLDMGRMDLLRVINLDLESLIRDRKLTVFLSDITIRYRNQILRDMANVQVESTFAKYDGGVYIPIKQVITSGDLNIIKAEAKVFYYDLAAKKSIYPPEDLLSLAELVRPADLTQ